MVFISSETGYSSSYAASASTVDAVVGVDAMTPSAKPQASSGLTLPLLQADTFISQRHEVNPAIALNLLQEIQAAITTWQAQQRQVIQAMQVLYAQGPMIDGWLQSSTAASEPTAPETAVLRHGDADALMQYVEAMENSSAAASPEATGHTPYATPSEPTQYLLCSLATDGTLQSQPCPPEQMAVVSTAIARHQKFKQLIVKKQAIEANLAQVVSQLTQVRTGVRELTD